ncbi:hypothetical protein SAMD00023353_2200310 [Rosellinia necatrix]|uniref:Uncharacterized protein n=1 Tax=Rosellinia necatrix TaxID=77044 RepID=A0A1S7UPP2_ROSNE|nr:hypothetical protein SAMD00023353_2200310 [Rosellinia necatrix]
MASASTPATSFSGDHDCRRGREKQGTATPSLPSPQQTDCSNTEAKSTDSDDERTGDERTDDERTDDEHTDDEIIERAFQAIWSSFCALHTESYPAFHFSRPSAFDRLQERLNEHAGLSHFVADKVRLDWNADTCDLIIRLMPTFVHDNFQDSVKFILENGLDRVAQEYPELEATRRMIIPGGHSSVTGKGFNKSPDGQLAFKGAKISPLFLEVAYSQGEKTLLNKLHEYFAKAPGCTILSFDLDYATPSTRRAEGYAHGASVSLATSKPDPEDPEYVVVEALVESEMFQQAGQAVQGNLKIPFNLFVPLEQREDLPACAAAAGVNVNFADLARFLSDAEEQQRIRDATPEPSKPIKGIKWRKRNGSVEASTIAL